MLVEVTHCLHRGLGLYFHREKAKYVVSSRDKLRGDLKRRNAQKVLRDSSRGIKFRLSIHHIPVTPRSRSPCCSGGKRSGTYKSFVVSQSRNKRMGSTMAVDATSSPSIRP